MNTFQIQTISSSSNCIACMAAAGQPARNAINLLLTIALSAVCIALLAACGGGGDSGGGNGGNGNGNDNGNRTGNGTDNDTTPNSFPSVSDLKIIPAESSLRLSWRNPESRRYQQLQCQLGEYDCD